MAKKQASIGCLFWIALILLVTVIILFNLKQINQVIKSTGMDQFVNRLFGREPAGPASPSEPPQAGPSEPPQPGGAASLPPESAAPSASPTEQITIEVGDEPPATATSVPENRNVRNANLYFARLEESGEISFIAVKRKVYYTDSPLTSTLEALIKGPSLEEVNRGLLNLVPADTKLRNVYVRGNTAYIDFNENFRFNNLGKEGLRVQLMQIVYTSTEFINVEYVQFLIEGQVVDYLGAEGLYIGEPLSRESF